MLCPNFEGDAFSLISILESLHIEDGSQTFGMACNGVLCLWSKGTLDKHVITFQFQDHTLAKI
jgi:hypothetical protein